MADCDVLALLLNEGNGGVIVLTDGVEYLCGCFIGFFTLGGDFDYVYFLHVQCIRGRARGSS